MKPLVAVRILTFNQERYIAQTLKSALEQVTNFEYIIIVGEDCSTDRTKEICVDYSNKYSDKIILISNEMNDIIKNSIDNFEECKNSGAKYIALLEGDDYWTDPYKLQKQVDFMEANPEFTLCYHPVNILYPDGRLERDYEFESLIKRSESTIYDMAVLGNYIHTPSVVFRNILKTFPQTFKESPLGDYFLWMLLAEKGKIAKLDDVMAVYRYGVGIHSSQSQLKRMNSFTKTLDLLSQTISDPTIIEILKNRIAAIKSASLPYTVKKLDDYGDLGKAENLKNFVSFGQVLKTIWLKIQRKL